MGYALCMSAQHNIYINETHDGYNRVRIVNDVNQIDFGTEKVAFWSHADSTSFDVSAVNLMTLNERDPWRTKVMPEKYHSDFDFDILGKNIRKNGLAKPYKSRAPEVEGRNERRPS